MAAQAQAITVTQANLHTIFGERDPKKRLAAISSLWVPSSEVLFVDPVGIFNSHQAISDMVEKLLAMGDPEDVFTELSEVECVPKNQESDMLVTRVKWGVGPAAGEYKVTGWDVVTVVGGKIKSCYTFLDSQ